MIELFVGAFLLWESFEDIKTQEIEVRILALFGVIAILLEVFYVRAGLGEMFLGAIVGLMALGVALVTRESIGYGDGVVMLIVGLCCGIKMMMEILVLAIAVLALVALITMAKKGVWADLRIPFIPCLLIGYIGGLML